MEALAPSAQALAGRLLPRFDAMADTLGRLRPWERRRTSRAWRRPSITRPRTCNGACCCRWSGGSSARADRPLRVACTESSAKARLHGWLTIYLSRL